jgi:hypothetical protein
VRKTAARSAAARRPSSAPLSITAKLSVSTAPPSAMTKSVKLKALAVQAKLRAQQTAAFATELGDERYDAFKPHFDGMQLLKVEKYARCVYHLELPAYLMRGLLVEEPVERGYAALVCDLCGPYR